MKVAIFLFNDAHNTFYLLLYGVSELMNDWNQVFTKKHITTFL